MVMFDRRQSEYLFLNTRHEVDQIHDLCQLRPRHMTQTCQLSLVIHGANANLHVKSKSPANSLS